MTEHKRTESAPSNWLGALQLIVCIIILIAIVTIVGTSLRYGYYEEVTHGKPGHNCVQPVVTEFFDGLKSIVEI